ncbi:MAG: HAD family hydrolase [Nanoarchaeota archaeon]|nr:HAD family hydrolase [Nanoarchaeota archaeon]
MADKIPPAVMAKARAKYQELFGKPQQEYLSHIRLFATDMEGTVFEKIPSHADRGVVAPSLWAVLMHSLGEEAFALESILQDQWFAQNMKQYGKFVRDTVVVMKEYGLTKDSFLKHVDEYEYNSGVHEAIKEIQDMGIYTGMITGGFEEQAMKAQKDLRLDSVSAACRFYWKPNGTIEHCNSLPWDADEKVHFIKSMMLELDARPSEVAYIGDSFNDLSIMRSVGLPILINPTDKELSEKDKALHKEVKAMENGVIVNSWKEVPDIVRNYPAKHYY